MHFHINRQINRTEHPELYLTAYKCLVFDEACIFNQWGRQTCKTCIMTTEKPHKGGNGSIPHTIHQEKYLKLIRELNVKNGIIEVLKENLVEFL